jgi:DNA-binding MarR family transcriptional regulator
MNSKSPANTTTKRTVCFDTRLTWLNIARMYHYEAESYGLSVSSAYLLLHIDSDGLPVTQIAPKLGMEPSSTTRPLNKLENDGLIERYRIPGQDRRQVMIRLTPEGIAARELARERVRHFNRLIRSHLGDAKLAVFFECMDTINGLIHSLSPAQLMGKTQISNVL